MTNYDGFLTKTEIEEFKKIALKDYKVKLANEQAFGQGAALITLFEHILKKNLHK